ncbi:MAG: regulator [Gammaproteobacteria bacterium]|nr:regulator [Gammaproteobacteria bacterium]
MNSKQETKIFVLVIFVTFLLMIGAYCVGKSKVEPPATVADKVSISTSHDVASKSEPAAHPEKNQFTQFEVGNSNVKTILVDGDVVWIGTSGGVIRYDTSNDSYKIFDNKIEGLLSNGIFYLRKIDHHLFVGTYGGGLSVYNTVLEKWKNYSVPQGLGDQFVYDVKQVSNGDIWIATWSGANRIKKGQMDDSKSWETYTVENTQGGLPNLWVYGIQEGKNGEIWFATEDGLARYHDGKWQNWKHKDGLGASYDIVKDSIQFTNDPGKVSTHHAQQKVEQGLSDVEVAYNPNYIISLVVDSSGIVWCGTWGGGLARFDGKHWKNYTTRDGLPANHVFMLHIDKSEQLWIGTSKGLAQFNKKSESFSVLTTADGLYADNVFSMSEAADGSLWVGSFGGVTHLTLSGMERIKNK